MRKFKRKGAYWYPTCEADYNPLTWSKDFSSLCIQKATSECLTRGCRPEDVIRLISDPFDFMLRYKLTGSDKGFIGDVQTSKTVRYYVSTAGQPMKKVAEPKGILGQYKRKNKLTDEYFDKIMLEIGLDVWDERVHTKNKSKYSIRTTSIQSGRLVKECNVASKFDWTDVDWDYYIKEIQKLLIGEQHV